MSRIVHWRAARGIAACSALLILPQPAAAHHSFAMFDTQKRVMLKGTVREFQWTNPHTWIQLAVAESGKQVEYSLEGSSPNNLARRGWGRKTLKAGDQITVTMNPLKNGEPGGSFVEVQLSDGSMLK